MPFKTMADMSVRARSFAPSAEASISSIAFTIFVLVAFRDHFFSYCNGILQAIFSDRGSSGRPAVVSPTLMPHLLHRATITPQRGAG